MKKLFFVLVALTFTLSACQNDDGFTYAMIETEFGDIKVKLYNATPQHRDNFIKLANEGFYKDLLFHRVMEGFMIQGGDPNSKGADASTQLGMGGPGYKVPAEIIDTLYHVKGALAAARQGGPGNPEKKSSGSQFYIVHGQVSTPAEMKQMEQSRNAQEQNNLMRAFIDNPANAAYLARLQRYQQEQMQDSLVALIEEIKPLALDGYVPSFQFTEKQVELYTTVGGAPFLDGDYTVFGEVVEGLDVVDKIATQQVRQERPVNDIKMNVRVLN